MSCFSCFSTNSRKSSKRIEYSPSPARKREYAPVAPGPKPSPVPNGNNDLNRKPREVAEKPTQETEPKNEGNGNIAAKTFTFRELASATKNFRSECLIGEGGFGRVYKGQLDDGQLAAIKQLDRNGFQGNREFLVEVLMLSLLHHPNLVNLIGYCADGDQRLLAYEFMPRGSLEDHLFDITDEQKPLSWSIRMKVAYGAAKGLEYLHEKASPPVIYRDLKSSNILLDEEYNPKLSDFGLAKLGPMGESVHVSSRVMGTYGYCAPEYARTGQLTLKSDVYSFGVVLLELITGRRVIDTFKPLHEQNLVIWAQPMFKDQNRYVELADPLLRGKFSVKGLNQAVAVAVMCLQEEASVRPVMADVVTALSFLLNDPDSCSEESSAQPTPIHSHQDSRTSDDCGSVLIGDDMGSERERIVQEAIQWGESSKQYNPSSEHVQITEMV